MLRWYLRLYLYRQPQMHQNSIIDVGFFAFGDALKADNMLAFFGFNNAHALGIAAHQGHFRGASAHGGALIGNQHDFIALKYLDRADNNTVAIRDLHGNYTLRTAPFDGKFSYCRAFAIAIFANGEHPGRRLWG